MLLVAVLDIGFASVATRGNDEDINHNQQVTVTPETPEEDEPVVVVEDEKLSKPFVVDAIIKTYYFDMNDTSKNQENALIYYNGMYTPSTGVDYFLNNSTFDVISAFSGVVTEKKVDPLYGATLYIKSDDNSSLVAMYSSLSDIKVNVGDKVEQGQVIAKAGSNTINSSMGNHLNFSLLKNNKTINPLNYYLKLIKDI
jgi:stage II sporulation protein Q